LANSSASSVGRAQCVEQMWDGLAADGPQGAMSIIVVADINGVNLFACIDEPLEAAAPSTDRGGRRFAKDSGSESPRKVRNRRQSREHSGLHRVVSRQGTRRLGRSRCLNSSRRHVGEGTTDRWGP